MTRRFYWIVFLIILISGNAMIAQTLEEDIEHSVHKYIFKLTNEEALSLYKNSFDERLLTNLIDSVLYDSVYNPLEVGHYLEVKAEKHEFVYQYFSKDEIFANILDNKVDLLIQLRDIKGNIIEDAVVTVGKSKIRYNSELKCFSKSKYNGNGVLVVTYNNHSSIFKLSKSKNSNYNYVSRWVFLYKRPIRYITVPVIRLIYNPIRSVVRVPYNFTKSLIHGENPFRYSRVFYNFRSTLNGNPQGIFKKIACVFNHEYCSKKYLTGDIIFNKPVFVTGDTLKFKALLWRKGKPWSRRNVNFSISKNCFDFKNEYKIIGKISPYSKGAYSGEFVLHDSLDLILNKDYYLKFKIKGFFAFSQEFRIEDYELKNNKIEVKNLEKQYFYNDTVKFTVSSFDINDLPLLDAKITYSVFPKNVEEYDTSFLVVPKIILRKDTLLSVTGLTNFSIPSTIFPCGKINYILKISCTTSDNELKNFDFDFTVDKLNNSSRTYLEEGSVVYKVFNYGKSINTRGTVDKFLDNSLVTTDSITIPYKERICQNISKYVFDNDNLSLSKTMKFNKDLGVISIDSERANDSVCVTISNNFRFSFVYQIFCGNRLIEYGSDSVKILKINLKRKEYKYYYINVQYVWAGESKSIEKIIPSFNKRLNIKLENNVTLIPGVENEISLKVTNNKGKKVRNANVLAYAYNNKFEKYSKPHIPYFDNITKSRKYYNSFSLSDKFVNDFSKVEMSYSNWKSVLRLTTNQFYNFLYPEKEVFQKSIDVHDSITQIAPFIIKNGEPLSIYYILIDDVPVYFGNTNTLEAYSFRSDTIINELLIRYTTGEVILKNIHIEKGKKTIISIDPIKCESSDFSLLPRNIYLNNYELNLLRKNLIVFNCKSILSWTYLLQNNRCFPLSIYTKPNEDIVCEPVFPVNATYRELNSFKRIFPVETNFEYSIDMNTVKMYRDEELFKYYESFNQPKYKPNESVTTESTILKKWRYYEPQIINTENEYYYSNEYDYLMYNSFLSISKVSKFKGEVLATMIKSDSISFLFQGEKIKFIHLSEGNCQVLYFLKDGTFCKSNVISVSEKNDSYFRFSCDSVYYYDFDSDVFNIKKFKEKPQVIDKDNFEDNQNIIYNYPVTTSSVSSVSLNLYNGRGIKISGVVYDGTTKEPLIGCCIIEEGTKNGTVTDFDGNFSIYVKDEKAAIEFSYIGYIKQEKKVGVNRYFSLTLKESEKHLDQVVRIGYGQYVRPENKYISSNLGDELEDINNSKDMNSKYNRLLSMPQAISTRTYFSDCAFWEPRLTSDKDGIVRFKTKIPGNITSWRTFFVATAKRDLTGVDQTILQSYKPLVSDLSLPRFMLVGDSCNILAKTKNYMERDMKIESKCTVNDSVYLNGNRTVSQIIIDTLGITATNSDSIIINYSLKTPDGYVDALEQSIPVFPLGTLETVGDFWILEKDTTFTISFADSIGKVDIYAESDELGTISREVENTLHYEHLCNEQLASKLISLFAKKRIAELMEEEVDIDKNVKFIIKKLLKNRNEDGLWGWWNVSKTEFIFSAHVWDALMQAKENGYEVDMEMHHTMSLLLSELGNANGTDLIYCMELFNRINPEFDLKPYITKADTMYHYAFADYLRLMRLKQKQGMEYSLDTLFKTMREDMFRGAFWPSGSYYLFGNSMRTTLLAYELIKGKNPESPTLPKIRRYFFKSRINGYWANTYESASIIENILEEIIDERGKLQSNTLRIKEAGDTLIDKFPYSACLKSGKTLTIQKMGNMPMYLTTYKKQWNPEPERIDKDFEVNSKFTGGELIGGKENTLEVTVYCKKESEFVMIEIPIPAGCSYADKKQNYNELHREYYKNKVCIFLRKMNTETQVFEVKLVPRYSGKYSLNPAKAELMYFPTFMGRTGMKLVRIVN